MIYVYTVRELSIQFLDEKKKENKVTLIDLDPQDDVLIKAKKGKSKDINYSLFLADLIL